MYRCAALPAYYAIREFKTRKSLIPLLVNLIMSKPDISCLFERGFPSEPLVKDARNVIKNAGIQGTSVSRVDIENKLRHVRNLVKVELRFLCGGALFSGFHSPH